MAENMYFPCEDCPLDKCPISGKDCPAVTNPWAFKIYWVHEMQEGEIPEEFLKAEDEEIPVEQAAKNGRRERFRKQKDPVFLVIKNKHVFIDGARFRILRTRERDRIVVANSKEDKVYSLHHSPNLQLHKMQLLYRIPNP